MNTKKYLNQLIQADNNRLGLVVEHLRKIVQLLEKNGEKTKKPTSEIMQIHSVIFSSKAVTAGLEDLYKACSDILEDYIKNHMLSNYLNEDKTALKYKQPTEVAEAFVSDWNTVHKLCTWLNRPFVELPKLQKFPSPLQEQPYLFFKQYIYCNEEIKKNVHAYLEDKLKEPAELAETTSGKGLPPHRAIIKAFVVMSYQLEDFSEAFASKIKKVFEEEIKEDAERQKKKRDETRSIHDMRAPYTSYASSSSYHSRPSAPTNFNPYKAESGHVGLKNQGATCYLNSLIQALFMTPAFRRAVFQWRYDPNTDKQESQCIPLQLQKLFAKLLLSEHKSVETKDLTVSFGWDTKESFIQHDVQELLRILFDALSTTNIPISELYQGYLRDYVICQSCLYAGGRRDSFLDIPLVVRDVRHLHEAIDNFQYEELLSGENQYRCDPCNTRVDALKGIKLLELPDILTFHLKRFDIDYNTFMRVKLNNEVIFPQTLDMNWHLKTHDSVKVSDIDSKYNIYNLYGILMHSGGASGGHYFAYIKDGDNWYEYNDSNVSKIDEKEIHEKAYGGSSSANAYMLLYTRQFPVSEVHNRLLSTSLVEEIESIPVEIRDEIEKQNAEYLKGQREYELKRDKANFNVYFNSKKHEISIEHTKTVGDLLKLAYDKIINPNSATLADVRLRKYDPQKKIPRDILANGDVLKDLDFSKQKMSLLLEAKRGDSFFEFDPLTQYVLRISKFDGSNSTFSEEQFVGVPIGCTLGQFRDLASEIVNVPSEKMILIFQRFINTVKTCIILNDPYADLQRGYSVQEGDTIYVEETNDSLSSDDQDSALVRFFDLADNILQLRYEVLDLPLAKRYADNVVKIDRRKRVSDLKKEISSRICIITDDFKLCYGRSDQSYVLNDLDERLYQFPNNLTLYVKKGEQLSSQQYTVTFYALKDTSEREEKQKKKEEEEKRLREEMMKRFPGTGRSMISDSLDNPYFRADSTGSGRTTRSKLNSWDCPRRVRWEDDEEDDGYSYYYHRNAPKWNKLFDTVLSKSQSVREIKMMLIELAKKQSGMPVPPGIEYLRLREKLAGRNYPGRILLDHEEPFQALASSVLSSVPNREIIIERLQFPETLTPNDMIIRVARWSPSKWCIETVKETVIGRDFTVFDLQQRVWALQDSRHDNPIQYADNIRTKKIPFQLVAQLRDNEMMVKLNWEEKGLNEETLVINGPWYLQDADLILYKDVTEVDWFTLHDKQDLLKPKKSAATSANATGGAASSSSKTTATEENRAGGISTSTLGGSNTRERALKFYNNTSKANPDKAAADSATTPDEKQPEDADKAGDDNNMRDD